MKFNEYSAKQMWYRMNNVISWLKNLDDVNYDIIHDAVSVKNYIEKLRREHKKGKPNEIS